MPRPGGVGGSVASRLAELFGRESKVAVADRVGVSRGSVYRWLNQERAIDREEAEKIARAYRVRAAWILFGEGPKHPEGDAGADGYRRGYVDALEWTRKRLDAEIRRAERAGDHDGLRSMSRADEAEPPP